MSVVALAFENLSDFSGVGVLPGGLLECIRHNTGAEYVYLISGENGAAGTVLRPA